MSEVNLADYVDEIRDFPKRGVKFKDTGPLLKYLFPETLDALEKLCSGIPCDYLAGVDARGFVLASGLAAKMGRGFIPVRKAGKLPPEDLVREAYQCEYGRGGLEVKAGMGRVILVDDVLATGGTLKAAADCLTRAGYEVTAILALMDLRSLNQFEWNGMKCRSLIQYD